MTIRGPANFLSVPGGVGNEQLTSEADTTAGRKSRLGMTPTNTDQQFSDEDELSIELPKMENRHSADIMSEQISKISDNHSRVASTSSISTVISISDNPPKDADVHLQHASNNNDGICHRENEKAVENLSQNHNIATSEDQNTNVNAKPDMYLNACTKSEAKRQNTLPEADGSLDRNSDDEYSSNYEDYEDTDGENMDIKSENNINNDRNEGSETEIKIPEKENDKASDSDKDDSSYNSNNYDSDDYEDETVSTDKDSSNYSVKLSMEEDVSERNTATCKSKKLASVTGTVTRGSIDYEDDFDSDETSTRSMSSNSDTDATDTDCLNPSTDLVDNTKATERHTNFPKSTNKHLDEGISTTIEQQNTVTDESLKDSFKQKVSEQHEIVSKQQPTVSLVKNATGKDTVITKDSQLRPSADNLNICHGTIQPGSAKANSDKKEIKLNNTPKSRKMLNKRPGSVPNRIIKETILVPSRQKLYKAPKNITIKSNNDVKLNKTDGLQKAPLPLINKQDEHMKVENQSMKLNKTHIPTTTQASNKISTDETVHVSQAYSLNDDRNEVQPRKPPTNVDTHYQKKLIIKPTNNMATTGTKQATPKKQIGQPDYSKRKNINDVTEQLIEINKRSYGSAEITVEEYDEKETNGSEHSHSVQRNIRKSHQTIFDSIETAQTDSLNTQQEVQCSDTSLDKEKANKTTDTVLTNGTQPDSVHSDHKFCSTAENKIELKSEENVQNQYSISSTSNLTSKGNDTSKTVTDKTNREEYLITGNKLIDPSAICEERKRKLDINNHSEIIPCNNTDVQDSEADYSTSETDEGDGNMEDVNGINFAKHRGVRKKPVSKNLYRSNTRPKNITTKHESRLLKYGLERPSSPFIFSGTKSYIRQSSVTSELEIHREDASTDDYQVNRKSKSGLADIARLRDIRRHLHLPDEIHSDDNDISKGCTKATEHRNSLDKEAVCTNVKLSAAPEILQIVASILNDVIKGVSSRAKRPSNILQRRCTATNKEGKDELCCILQAPFFIFNLSVVKCSILDVHDVKPVTKTRHETLLSNIIKIASPDSGEMKNEAGLVVLIPVEESCLQSWQQAVVRVLDDTGDWVDIEGEGGVIHIHDGKRIISVTEIHLTDEVTLAVVARPKLDRFYIPGAGVKVTSSVNPKIEVSLTSKSEEQQRCLSLQTIPIDMQTLTWFSRLHSDDDDYQILSCSPLVCVQVSSQHAESLQFRVPYVSLYSRPSKKSAYMFSTSCVHSPMPRIPSPYTRKLPAGVTQTTSGISSSGKSQLTPRNLGSRQENTTSQSTGRGKVHIPSGEKHLAVLKEGPGKLMRTVSLTKVTDVTDESFLFGVYENSSSVVVIETRTGLQYTSIEEVTRAFAEFISLKKVTVKVYQTLSEVQALHIDFGDCHTKTNTPVDEAGYYNYSETELILNEGDVIAFSFKGNIQQKTTTQTQFCYYSFKGFKAICLLDVQNPYGQRSLPTFHGMLQIFSQSEARAGPIDDKTIPNLDQGWECIVEVPVTLPKVIAKITSTVSKAPLALELEEPLTPDFMRLLCRDLRNDWERFAKELHIGRARIQSIKQQNKSTIPEKIIMDILANWLKRQPKVNDKATPLITALKRCNKWQLAAELRERQKAVSAIRSETVDDIRLQKAIILACKSPCVCRKWRQLYSRLNTVSTDGVIEEANEIEAVHVSDATCCQTALCRWKERSNKPTIWMLVDALRAVRCAVVAGIIALKLMQ